jgi:hypothetical protein
LADSFLKKNKIDTKDDLYKYNNPNDVEHFLPDISLEIFNKFLIYKHFTMQIRELGSNCFVPNSMEDVDFVVELMSGIFSMKMSRKLDLILNC